MARPKFLLAVLLVGFLVGSAGPQAAAAAEEAAAEPAPAAGCQPVAVDLTSPEVLSLLQAHKPFATLGDPVTREEGGVQTSTQRIVSIADPSIVVGVSCSATCTNPSQCRVYGCNRIRYADGTYGCSACSCITATGGPCGGTCTCTKLDTEPAPEP